MYLTVKPKLDDKNKLVDVQSLYQPTKKEKERMIDIMRDFQLAQSLRDATYQEFSSSNDEEQSLIDFKNQLVKRFNNVIPPVSDDPNQAWRANTIRPLTRNKCISIIAHLSDMIMYPGVTAQNDESVEDKDTASVMKDCVEWVYEQEDYEDLFIKICYELCYSPAVITTQGFSKVKKLSKKITGKNKWVEEEVEDDLYSGFYNEVIPVEELYIENMYEPNIQKQGFLIRVRAIPFNVAKAKHKDYKNFKYVRPGYINYFSEEEDSFYEQHDENNEERLVQEVIYYNRDADLELRLINGILMDEDIDRPMQRIDKRYPFSKTVYELFNTRFFYGMPLVAKIKPDQDVIDTLYNMIIDGTFLQTFPVLASYGRDDIDSSVIAPANVVAFTNPNSKLEPLTTNGNMSTAMNALQKVESSASESSQDPLQSGQGMGGDRTKYEVQRLEMNARTVLGLAGKSIISIVKQIGQLTISDVLQYMPIAEVSDITSDNLRLKFPKIFVPEKKGERKGRKIEFTNDMPESKEQEDEMIYEMLAEEFEKGYEIIKVNPKMFRKMKYLIKVEPEFSDVATKFYKKLQLYDRAIMNPIINPEVATRKLLLGAYVPGEEDEFIMKQPTNPANSPEANMVQGGQAQQEQNKKTAVTQITTPQPGMEAGLQI